MAEAQGAKIIVTTDGGERFETTLPSGVYRLGHGFECDFVIAAAHASRAADLIVGPEPDYRVAIFVHSSPLPPRSVVEPHRFADMPAGRPVAAGGFSVEAIAAAPWAQAVRAALGASAPASRVTQSFHAVSSTLAERMRAKRSGGSWIGWALVTSAALVALAVSVLPTLRAAASHNGASTSAGAKNATSASPSAAELLRERVARLGLPVSVSVKPDATLEASGAVSERERAALAEIAREIRAQTGTQVEIRLAEVAAAAAGVRGVSLAPRKLVVDASGALVGPGGTLSSGWTVETIDADVIALTRDGAKEIVRLDAGGGHVR